MVHGLKNDEGFFDSNGLSEMGFYVGLQGSPIRSLSHTHSEGGGLGLGG